MHCRKIFSGQNGDSIAGRIPFISHSNVTLRQSMIYTVGKLRVPATWQYQHLQSGHLPNVALFDRTSLIY